MNQINGLGECEDDDADGVDDDGAVGARPIHDCGETQLIVMGPHASESPSPLDGDSQGPKARISTRATRSSESTAFDASVQQSNSPTALGRAYGRARGQPTRLIMAGGIAGR